MIDHAHFLAEIQRQLEAELPRLIYADWLEEQGHPGAELIRLEIARAKLPPWTEEYAALQHCWRPLWERMDPEFLHPLGYQWLHRPLFTRLPESREDRWRLVDRFFDNWFGGLRSSDNYTDADIDEAGNRLGICIPAALREWFTRGGAAHALCNRQGYLRPPAQWWLMENQEALHFAVEHQGTEHWGIAVGDLEQDDPPVRRLQNLEIVCDSVTRFVIHWMLSSVKSVPNIQTGWCYRFEEEGLPELGAGFPRTDVPNSVRGGSGPIFLEGADLILESFPQDVILWVNARTNSAANQLPQKILNALDWI